ncbi:MAG: 4Fe-4S dicluster domain-containing protein [Proteobacteria bacterium]|nr:4Fe-4S dicluster domain-containing protein [Pseudomonadota bacterium]
MAERLNSEHLDDLIALMRGDGYRVIGPTIRDEAIVYDELRSAADLPWGFTDQQGPGRYRLQRRPDRAAFGYVVGPHSWKRFLFPPREQLVRIRRGSDSPQWTAATDDGPGLALLGVRACELAAIAIQDRVFMGGPFVDGRYRVRRERCLIIAVNCTEAGELCFCDSMDTGPEVQGDYDLRMTELGTELVLDAGSARGRELLERLPSRPAEDSVADRAQAAIERCRRSMGRRLDTRDLPARLMGNLDHPRYQDVADRCLACGNCTSVCPTCFCFTISDTSGVTDGEAGRERSWDSCFGAEHSTIHGAQFRPDVRSRYQQWLTHKLATWTAQFGTSGCVGCGRCIAWCPVGIDLTVEASTIAAGAGDPVPLPPVQSYAPRAGDGLVPVPARVLEVHRETHDVVNLVLQAPAGYAPEHGQFNMLSLPAIGDVPMSISGSGDGVLEHTLRSVGNATRALAGLREGAVVGLRGPFGKPWPLEQAVGRHLVLIAGGIGLAPLRSAVRETVQRPKDFPNVRILYGTRSPDDIIYDRELLGWIQASHLRAHVTVDRGDRSWSGNIGVVTKLMRRKHTPRSGLYFLCGPEIMMRYALAELDRLGIPAEHIYLSLERNMKCAVGICGRCQYGPHFVCKDGPVFRYDQIASIFGKVGF